MKPLLFAISLFISWQLAASELSTEQKQAQPASGNEPEKKDVDSLEFIEQKSATQQVPSSAQAKKPVAEVDDSKVLGSQNPAPAEQPKTAEEKQEAVNEAEQAVAKAKKALTEKQQEKARQSREATAVIEQVIAAYNARNIDAFIKMYDENVEFYTFPNELMFTGKEKLIARYGIMFKKLKCIKSSPIKRIVHGNIVIDHELSETCSEDPNVVDKRAEFVTSYQIENGKITKVLFFR
ncbi:nuclear transport factor 2 family protein [Pseudoalteromonas sp. L1]|uniref:nuclear transport factor 2 family protein n=1 Tax=Pseudoalteromonas sp. L1 TaxID=195716 RepID=UPI001F342290|nr:nuclear transport factor 2 family protein [Pseudoalteromonas sp. L1]